MLVGILKIMVDDGSTRRYQAHNGRLRTIGILPVHSAIRHIEITLNKACLSGTSCGETCLVKESFEFGAAPFGTAPVHDEMLGFRCPQPNL